MRGSSSDNLLLVDEGRGRPNTPKRGADDEASLNSGHPR